MVALEQYNGCQYLGSPPHCSQHGPTQCEYRVVRLGTGRGRVGSLVRGRPPVQGLLSNDGIWRHHPTGAASLTTATTIERCVFGSNHSTHADGGFSGEMAASIVILFRASSYVDGRRGD